MAAFTSNVVTGNWSATATWAGGVVPANGGTPGDTVTIAAGAVVTVDTNWTIGSSPATAGTAAIAVTGTTGHLIIGAGITLVARGDININNALFTLQAGAGLEFDASAASVPASTNYELNMGNSTGNTANVLTINGTAGARCFIRSNNTGGAGNASIDNSGRYAATIRYCDFTRMGTASTSAIQSYEYTFDLEQCVFDTCGKIEFFFEGAAYTNRLANVTMKNTLATSCINTGGAAVALTSGTRVVTSCVFDKLATNGWNAYTITDTVFSGAAQPISGSGVTQWTAFTGNLLVWGTANSDAIINGSVANSYCLANFASTNPHYLTPSASVTTPSRDIAVTGCVFETTGNQTDGDCVTVGAPGGASVYTVADNIGLPNGNGTGPPGTVLSALGNANASMIVRHNTWFLGTACTVIGETYAGFAGALQEFRDNLCWDTSVHATGYKLRDSLGSVVDHVSSANCHHNAGYLFQAGSNLKGYSNLLFSSGAPGANDVDDIDPDFVDDTRDIAAWDLSLGGPGTAANALTELKKKNEVGYNPLYTIAALVTWVKAGFLPQASAIHAASDSVAPSNGWIGALQGVSSAVDHSRLMLLGVGA